MALKVGVALGAGGARGFAHIGVLKVLQEEHIPIDCITGSSAGAIVGAMYAQQPDIHSLIERFERSLDEDSYERLGLSYLKSNCDQNDSFFRHVTQNIKRRIIINLAQNRQSLLKDMTIRSIVSEVIDEGTIDTTKIPLGIVATSVHTGDSLLLTEGNIIDAVVASCSVPGFFPPTEHNGHLLVDGGVSCPVPVQFLDQMGADVTIAVEIGIRQCVPLRAFNVIEIIDRSTMISSLNLARIMAGTADVVICPDTRDVDWSDFYRADELIEAGMMSAREKIPDIKRLLNRRFPVIKKFILSKIKQFF